MLKPWTTTGWAEFGLVVAEIIKDWRTGDIDAEEAMAKVSYEYVQHIGELK